MDWKNYFSCVLKGLIGSIAVTVILTAILSLFMTFVEISESMFSGLYVVITSLGLVFGTILAAKLHGKNGCMAYREGLRSGVRKQLGFAFKDISEHLPGAFIIYRADKEDDELFYANDEFFHMAGYKDIDELFKFTKKSFRNLIREDEQQQIESSIWEQIDNGNENDYIHFHLRKADGSYLSVLDHGRIVESPQYGKVFYVLFIDWEDMHIRYSDKFSR